MTGACGNGTDFKGKTMLLKLIVLVLFIGTILVSFNVFSRRNLKKDKNNVINKQADPEEMISCDICGTFVAIKKNCGRGDCLY